METKEIILKTADWQTFYIDPEYIVAFNIDIKIEDIMRVDEDENKCEYESVPLINSLLLVLQNYEKIKDIDGNVFNPYKRNISALSFIDKKGYRQEAFANLTSQNFNYKQINQIADGRVYIEIEL